MGYIFICGCNQMLCVLKLSNGTFDNRTQSNSPKKVNNRIKPKVRFTQLQIYKSEKSKTGTFTVLLCPHMTKLRVPQSPRSFGQRLKRDAI